MRRISPLMLVVLSTPFLDIEGVNTLFVGFCFVPVVVCS